jgi:hypothetical protein
MAENDSPTVTERSWYGDRMGTPNTMTRDQFGLDMADMREWGEQINVWSGADRHGFPLRVVWVTRPHMGTATLYAYEISGETS